MNCSRRLSQLKHVIALAIALTAIAGCAREVQQESPSASAAIAPGEIGVEAIDKGLAKAVQFLVSRQSPDGAWRSDVYSPFKVGDALTPMVLLALTAVPTAERPQAAVERGLEFLATLVGPDGNIVPPRYGIAYPVYTAAGALLVLGDRSDGKSQQARKAWLNYLRARQLTETNGWDPQDPSYGGWGYDAELPRKPAEGVPVGPLTEPNLSATVFALAALRAAGVQPPDEELDKALRFVERCQNLAAAAVANPSGAPRADTQFDDGGFYFLQSDVVRNKAGLAGKDSSGRERFSSYGSATADGLRSYLAAGLKPDDPRLQAAWHWLAQNFSAEQHPGQYAEGRRAERDSVYYYYCHSLSEALADPSATAPAEVDRVAWARTLSAALLARQKPDGSWSNPEVEVREDDPLVATSLATRALAMCRRVLVVESQTASGAAADDDRPQPQDPPADQTR